MSLHCGLLTGGYDSLNNRHRAFLTKGRMLQSIVREERVGEDKDRSHHMVIH